MRIRLVLTDLDNTLYDWVAFFVPALYAMVEVACGILKVPQDVLLRDLKEVHQRHHNSEHPFALEETASVLKAFPGVAGPEIRRRLDPAYHAFNRVRKSSLLAYDGVAQTLEMLKEREIPVFAYTDARIQNALFRLRKLSLVSLISRLYAPAHIGRDGTYETAEDEFIRLLPPRDRKPNPRAILDICGDLRVEPEEVLFVGDSLARDVFMAKSAGAVAVWARYGTQVDPEYWSKLVKVTHWTEADVEADAKLRRQAASVEPDFTIGSFSRILAIIDGFGLSVAGPSPQPPRPSAMPRHL